MAFAESTSPSLPLVDFRLKGIQGSRLPVLSHLTNGQRVRLGSNANKRQQVDVPLINARCRPSCNDFLRALEVRELSSQHVLCGFEYPATGR